MILLKNAMIANHNIHKISRLLKRRLYHAILPCMVSYCLLENWKNSELVWLNNVQIL